jgi:hypothetical protein
MPKKERDIKSEDEKISGTENKSEKAQEFSSGKGTSNLTERVRSNPWVVSTFILGVVVIILLLGNVSITGGSVAVASKTDVQTKVLAFVNSQVTTPVELVNTTLKNGLYEILFRELHLLMI